MIINHDTGVNMDERGGLSVGEQAAPEDEIIETEKFKVGDLQVEMQVSGGDGIDGTAEEPSATNPEPEQSEQPEQEQGEAAKGDFTEEQMALMLHFAKLIDAEEDPERKAELEQVFRKIAEGDYSRSVVDGGVCFTIKVKKGPSKEDLEKQREILDRVMLRMSEKENMTAEDKELWGKISEWKERNGMGAGDRTKQEQKGAEQKVAEQQLAQKPKVAEQKVAEQKTEKPKPEGQKTQPPKVDNNKKQEPPAKQQDMQKKSTPPTEQETHKQSVAALSPSGSLMSALSRVKPSANSVDSPHPVMSEQIQKKEQDKGRSR
jgi:hypothetical protein